MTRVVLGIDAAWTAHIPSGVAVIADAKGWHLVAAASSYDEFHLACGQELCAQPSAAGGLVASVEAMTGAPPDIVAVDMPLAKVPITGRRVSDNLISSAYGGRGAGTHSPSAVRSGPVGSALSKGFFALGYQLAVETLSEKALVEVYPHPALIELSGAAQRLPYKIARARKYWPEADGLERKARLLAQWKTITELLETQVFGLGVLSLPQPNKPTARFKAFEDMLDAVVCCWVGAMVLDGRAKSYGDEFSAVWVPERPTGHLQRVAVGE